MRGVCGDSIGRDECRFINPASNPSFDAREWAAAVSQLNMAYESLPYRLLLVRSPPPDLDAPLYAVWMSADNS